MGVALAVGMTERVRRQYAVWTDEEKDTVRRLTREGYSARAIAERLGPHRSESKVHELRDRLCIGPMQTATVRPVASYQPPTAPDIGAQYSAVVQSPEDSRDETTEEFLSRMFAQAERSVQKAKAQRHATIKLASDRPVGITFLGDQHIDTKGTDLHFLKRTADYVAEMDGLYAILLGDLLQNNIVHRDKDVRSVADQMRFADLYIQWMRGKLLGGVTGNHDDWTVAAAGFDHIKALANKHRFHVVPDELIWKVQVHSPHDVDDVTAEWALATRHQFRRHSNLNPLHACWRWLEEQVGSWEVVPDVLVLAHNHSAAVGVHNYAGKDVWGIRMGSAQIDSAYARSKGFQDFRPTAPVAVLPPTRRERLVCFSDADQAVQHLRGWQRAA